MAEPDRTNNKNPSYFPVIRESYAGPLPHPKHLEAYEKVYPGAAKIIFTMAQSQTKHRQALEMKVINANLGNERLGMWLAFILAFIFASFGFWLVYTGKNVPLGFFTLLGPMIIQGANFFYQKRNENQEVKEESPIEGEKEQ